MTEDTQELDEKIGNIIDDLVNIEISARFHNTDWAEYGIKQALLDWHNKQIEAVLDRLEQSAPDYSEMDSYNRSFLKAMYENTIIEAIKAERAKLKERDDE